MKRKWLQTLLGCSMVTLLMACNPPEGSHNHPSSVDPAAPSVQQAPDAHGAHQMSIHSEQDFIVQMIPHHTEAIVTSEWLLKHTQNPQLKAFAQEVIVVQKAEIQKMKDWHQAWYGAPFVDPGSYKPMMPMNAASPYEGEKSDQAYIKGMIGHHQGAVDMANQLKTMTQRPELLSFARTIIDTQSKEIEQLKQWVK